MSVLPAKSVADALPENLANLIAIAENMDDDDATSNTSPRHQHDSGNNDSRTQQQPAGSCMSAAHDTKQQRQAGPAIAATTAFSALACASENLGHDPGTADKEAAGSEGFTSHQQTIDPGSCEFHELLGFELTGDRDADLLRLAQELSATFPSDVAPLVDLTGGPAGGVPCMSLLPSPKQKDRPQDRMYNRTESTCMHLLQIAKTDV